MPRSSVINIILAIFVTAVLCGCSRDWPPKDVAQVRAYLFNLSSRDDPAIVTNGALHESIVDTNGVRLTNEEVATLVKATTGKHPPHEMALCYVPHHGYVFYDERGRIVAWVEICFGCMQYRASSKAAPEIFDLERLRKLTVELGIPVFDKDTEYVELERRAKRTNESTSALP